MDGETHRQAATRQRRLERFSKSREDGSVEDLARQLEEMPMPSRQQLTNTQ